MNTITQTLGQQSFPVTTNASSLEQRSQESTHRVAHSPKSILMIQDNSTLANILKTFFESRSFTVDCVSNAADAMSKILRKDYDVLLCEMVTRQFRGDMFFFAVERTKPHLCGRFVFLVAQKARAESMELLRIKGSVLVKRPFRVSKLLELITEMLKGNSSKIGPEEVGSRQTTQ